MVPVNRELLEALRAHRPADAAVVARIPKYATYKRDVEAWAKIPWREVSGRLAAKTGHFQGVTIDPSLSAD